MFLGDPPRPNALPQVFERFWFADALKRIFQDGLHQLNQALSGAWLVANPMLQVI
jgi:hypothetical protein